MPFRPARAYADEEIEENEPTAATNSELNEDIDRNEVPARASGSHDSPRRSSRDQQDHGQHVEENAFRLPPHVTRHTLREIYGRR